MKHSNDTRTAILDTTQDLVQRQSISGVSFQDLADRIGIKKGSMYYHFKSKDDLSIAMLDRAGQQLKDSFKRGYEKTATNQLSYFLKIYSEYIGAGTRMCPGGAYVGEWDKLSNPVKSRVKWLIEIQNKGLKKILAAGVKNDEFETHGMSIDELALWLVSNLQGALLTSRVVGNKEPFEAIVQVIGRFLQVK